MAGFAGADLLIRRTRQRSARIAGDGPLHTLDVIEHCFDSPETTTREHCRILSGNGSELASHRGNSDRRGGGVRNAARQSGGDEQDGDGNDHDGGVVEEAIHSVTLQSVLNPDMYVLSPSVASRWRTDQVKMGAILRSLPRRNG